MESSHRSIPLGVPDKRGLAIVDSMSVKGKQRIVNEDTVVALSGSEAPAGAEALLVVADGVGGSHAGEVASSTAVHSLVRELQVRLPTLRQAGGVQEPIAMLRNIVAEVNLEVHRSGLSASLRGMATTLTVALLRSGHLFVAHVGDSRAYLVRDRLAQQLTTDHTWVADQLAKGMLTRQEAQTHPRRNILTRAVGEAPGVYVDAEALRLEDGDVVLLCTDGLYSSLADHELAGLASDGEPKQVSRRLVSHAESAGGYDDISVALARFART